MANYSLDQDPATGVITCRVLDFISDAEAQALARDIRVMAQGSRHARGTVRMLFDNQRGKVFSSAAMQALGGDLKATRCSGDRTAILVSCSLNKMQAKRAMSEGSEVFLSESAAMTWLTAWDRAAAAS